MEAGNKKQRLPASTDLTRLLDVPMPDERHSGFGLGLGGPLVPLFALLAIRKLPDAKGMKLFLGFIFVGSVIVLAIIFQRRIVQGLTAGAIKG